MMISVNTSQKGFSLIELMVTMAIASVLMAGIYKFYHQQLKTHITQEQMVDMQQDARAAMYMMTREIRMAGFDPGNTGEVGIQTANVAEIAFDSDDNGNGDIDTNERFYYRLDNGNLERGRYDDLVNLNPVAMNPVALNIDALNFVYLDNAGDTTSDLEVIRSVQITLVARSGDKVPALMRKRTDRTAYTNQQGTVILPAPNDNFRRIRLTTAVKVRNLGL